MDGLERISRKRDFTFIFKALKVQRHCVQKLFPKQSMLSRARKYGEECHTGSGYPSKTSNFRIGPLVPGHLGYLGSVRL
jgi:hypothetical protein